MRPHHYDHFDYFGTELNVTCDRTDCDVAPEKLQSKSVVSFGGHDSTPPVACEFYGDYWHGSRNVFRGNYIDKHGAAMAQVIEMWDTAWEAITDLLGGDHTRFSENRAYMRHNPRCCAWWKDSGVPDIQDVNDLWEYMLF